MLRQLQMLHIDLVDLVLPLHPSFTLLSHQNPHRHHTQANQLLLDRAELQIRRLEPRLEQLVAKRRLPQLSKPSHLQLRLQHQRRAEQQLQPTQSRDLLRDRDQNMPALGVCFIFSSIRCVLDSQSWKLRQRWGEIRTRLFLRKTPRTLEPEQAKC